MDPKEKKTEEELNTEKKVENSHTAEETPQDEPVEEQIQLTPEEQLTKELEEANSTIEDQKDKYLRLSAEFDNYRKRTMKVVLLSLMKLMVAKRALAVFYLLLTISSVPSKRWKQQLM